MIPGSGSVIFLLFVLVTVPIISVDVYGDTQEIIEDCLDVLEPFIEEVIPKERKDQYYDYSEVIEIDLILEEYFNAA